MRTGLASVATLLLGCLCVANSSLADSPADAFSNEIKTVNIGGLSLAPPAFRYRPDRTAQFALAPAVAPRIAPGYRFAMLNDALASSYVPNRESLLNSIRSRRGLALVTFWESAERCLFFGLNNRGQPGLSFVHRRSLETATAAPVSSATRALFAEITQQPMPTFPEAPGVFFSP